MAEQAQAMVKEVKAEKKAFMAKPYSREDKIKKDCAERKKNPPKITPLQKKLFNQIVLQDA